MSLCPRKSVVNVALEIKNEILLAGYRRLYVATPVIHVRMLIFIMYSILKYKFKMVLIFFLTGGSVKQVFKPPDLSPCIKHRGGPACVILGVAVLACWVSYSRRVLILIEHEWCRHVL